MESFSIGAVELIIICGCELQNCQRTAGQIAVELFLWSDADLQSSNHSLPHMPWIRKTFSLSNSQCSLCSSFPFSTSFKVKMKGILLFVQVYNFSINSNYCL